MSAFPDKIETEQQLEEVLTQPSAELIESIQQLASPLVVIGAGGKMGPTLAVLAKNAAEACGHDLQVIAASRFSNPESREWLESRAVQTQAVDMFDREQVSQLPESRNVVYLVGMKFGTSDNPVPTWATNTVIPMLTAERYVGSKIVALSTGNVYPLSPVSAGGSTEGDPLTPMGEYANAAVARERVFQHYAVRDQTPMTLLRLNYAHDLRYGVLSELAAKVWQDQEIDLATGYFNAIWQGDANEVALRSFKLCSVPATAVNLTSPEVYRVRDVAKRLGELMDRTPSFVGNEAETALLGNASLMAREFGPPRADLEQMLTWIAQWTSSGGRSINRPTHFATRDGKY